MRHPPCVSELVDRFDDPRLADYRNLPDRQLLDGHGIFVAEGRLVVSRLLASTTFATRSVMVTRQSVDALGDVLAGRPDVRVFEVSQDTMNQVTGIDMHRGCLAIGERPREATLEDLSTSARRIVGVEGVGNADNIGGIFRNAAAFGVDGVLLDRTSADPLYRKALRTSMGAALQVPFSRAAEWRPTLAGYRAAGWRLLALTPAPDASPVARVAAALRRERVVVIVGHEGSGLSEETLSACDCLARIPMAPGVDSLNVATAVAVGLYELRVE